MSTTPRTNPTSGALRRLLKPAALVAALAVAASAGAAAATHGVAWHHGGAALSADEFAAHVDKFLQHVYIEIDATPAQQAQLDPIVKQAVADLMPLHENMREFHTKALAALTADSVDRTALEALRAEHVQAADGASRRITQLIGDVADVLTPAQRRTLAARIAEQHGLQ